MRCNLLIVVVLVTCLLVPEPAAGRRPGRPTRRRIQPTPEELFQLPPNAVFNPPPERSAVEPVPSAEYLPLVTEPEPEAPDADNARQTCGSYTETDIRPLRQQWDSGNGYCGEMSLQLIAMTRGIYISQKTSRRLGVAPGANHPDLLFDERIQPESSMSGVYGVSKMLGLYQPPESYWFSDNMTRSATKQLTPSPAAFAVWMKQNIMAGRPVIGGFRVSGGGYEDYDHIMPVYGICQSNSNSLANSDNFVFTDNYMSELRHTPNDRNFYAGFKKCGYTGCIPNDYWDYGVAVGPLNVPSGVFFPVRIRITGWSDGSAVNMEPGEYGTTSATASYSLTVSALAAGQKYTVYRTTGLFAGFKIPQSAAALAAVCTAQAAGCRSISFTATASSMSLTQEHLGAFAAPSVTYFLAVRS